MADTGRQKYTPPVASTTPPQPETQVDPATANYRPAGPHCHTCQYFVEGLGEEGTCTKVSGPISEDYLCDLFAPMPQSGSDVAAGLSGEAETE
jgi:hypothetical protein